MSWHIEQQRTLAITSGPKTDWFVVPFEGTVAIAVTGSAVYLKVAKSGQAYVFYSSDDDKA